MPAMLRIEMWLGKTSDQVHWTDRKGNGDFALYAETVSQVSFYIFKTFSYFNNVTDNKKRCRYVIFKFLYIFSLS
mgnify:CR=1 FL=1